MTTKYDDKRIVYVTPFQGSPVRYGWATNVDETRVAPLGHTLLTGQAPQGYVFGANAPKPAVATKLFATGSVSSFIDAASVETARTQGWKIGRAKVGRGGSAPRSTRVYVTFQGIKYAWNLPNTTRQRIGDITALGIRESTTADNDLVIGANFPKPPRARRVEITGDNSDTLETFFDPSVTLPNGWSAVSSGQDPTQAPT